MFAKKMTLLWIFLHKPIHWLEIWGWHAVDWLIFPSIHGWSFLKIRVSVGHFLWTSGATSPSFSSFKSNFWLVKSTLLHFVRTKSTMNQPWFSWWNHPILPVKSSCLVPPLLKKQRRVTANPWAGSLGEAPSIIFIDELDAIGQKRSGGGELSGVERFCAGFFCFETHG